MTTSHLHGVEPVVDRQRLRAVSSGAIIGLDTTDGRPAWTATVGRSLRRECS